jgi:hypothetical protein
MSTVPPLTSVPLVQLRRVSHALAVVSLLGDQDASCHDPREEALDAAVAHGDVLLDLRWCDSIDAGAIGFLIAAPGVARASERRLALLIRPEDNPVKAAVERRRLGNIVPVHTNPRTAFESFRSRVALPSAKPRTSTP